MSEVQDTQVSDYGDDLDGFTTEFLQGVRQGLNYHDLETSISDRGVSQVYTFEKGAFNTYLSFSARDVYDDVLIYHLVDPGKYRQGRKHSAEEIAEQIGFKLDQEGMAYTRVRPGIVGQKDQPKELLEEIEALDDALYRNATGESLYEIKNDLQNRLEEERIHEKLWRKAKNELGI